MSRSVHKEKLVGFLETIRHPDRPLDAEDEDRGLIASGLVDSLAALQIIMYLEATYGIDFSESGIDPEELRSIASILDLIERESAR